MSKVTHTTTHAVRFADCDPAGIVHYPRFFSWFDRTFHDWLWIHSGHQTICAKLGLIGIGLIAADAKFESPATDGDDLTIQMTLEAWGNKSLSLSYRITCESRLIATGTEVRGLFEQTADGVKAALMPKLKDLIDVRQ
ncbi:MAG: acyl-CoA thioesterase [Gammaproteobacteria bacterium]|nr:acyl-CoA thioesterase [Gammaproteobacteria bacterium]